MVTNFRSPNLLRELFFFRFSPGNLLIILYQLIKSETSSYNSYRDSMITNCKSPNLQKKIIRKKKYITFLNFLPGNLLIFFYKPT